MQKVKIIECPRDAMQGLAQIVTTEHKVQYINALLKVGFDTIDVGSFVSPRAVPQLADTVEVLNQIDLSQTSSKLLTIVANAQGAKRAAEFDEVTYLGYPFSISETFQIRNTNATIAESENRLRDIQEICVAKNKKLVVYISMGFGNPYGDAWSPALVTDWTLRLREKLKVDIFSISDTVGAASPAMIQEVFSAIMPFAEGIEIGAHLHAMPNEWQEKVKATLDAGCFRIDGAINGLGGCPFAADKLTGNLPTEQLVQWLTQKNYTLNLNTDALEEAVKFAQHLFS
jgi:hydroxymethylglutaryl-CoA lyase